MKIPFCSDPLRFNVYPVFLAQWSAKSWDYHPSWCFVGSQLVLVGKNPCANTGDIRNMGSIPGSEKSPGGGLGNPLQYSCLENLMDREAWQVTVHRVAKRWTQMKRLSMHTCTHDSLPNLKLEAKWLRMFKLSPGSQSHSLSQLTDDLPQDPLFFPPNPVNIIIYHKKKKKANVYYNVPLNPSALEHNIFCLVHLSKVVLITEEFSASNIYLTKKKSVCGSIFLWNTQRISKEEHHLSKTGKSPRYQGNSVFDFLLNEEQKADWFPHWTNDRSLSRGP